MDTDSINLVFNAILEDESLLDDVSSDLVSEFRDYLGFYLIDRDIEELDFRG